MFYHCMHYYYIYIFLKEFYVQIYNSNLNKYYERCMFPFFKLQSIQSDAQGAYRFLKINSRPFLRCFKTDFSGI